MFDWRGQGLSDRLIDNPYLGHIDDFSSYDKEFEEIIDKVYLPFCPKPWIGMGHSMGGWLIAAKGETRPEIFKLIILCAPMLSLKLSKSLEVFGLLVGGFWVSIFQTFHIFFCIKRMLEFASSFKHLSMTFGVILGAEIEEH